jgi:hypothetical protein
MGGMKPIPEAQNRQTSEQAENESYKHGNHCAQHSDSIKACEVSLFKLSVGKISFSAWLNTVSGQRTIRAVAVWPGDGVDF